MCIPQISGILLRGYTLLAVSALCRCLECFHAHIHSNCLPNDLDLLDGCLSRSCSKHASIEGKSGGIYRWEDFPRRVRLCRYTTTKPAVQYGFLYSVRWRDIYISSNSRSALWCQCQRQRGKQQLWAECSHSLRHRRVVATGSAMVRLGKEKAWTTPPAEHEHVGTFELHQNSV